MVRKVSEILKEKERTYSFELFPPRTEKGMKTLFETTEELGKLEPDWVSVTYGAGGSTSKSTLEIIKKIQESYGLNCMHHLTLVGQKADELKDIVKEILDAGVVNILALRGDPPPDMGDKFVKVDGGLEYCYELIAMIRDLGGDSVSIAVAGFPEGHVDCPNKELDSKYLKLKCEHGGESVITQFFFENEIYSEYLNRVREAGVDVPILPGILPIIDYKRLLKFCDTCGAYICDEVHKIFKPLQDDEAATLEHGTRFAIDQCEDLIKRGAPGLHFYCLNKVEPIKTIWQAVKKEM